MKIHEVSTTFDISADTLRYYERIGLIHNVPRNPSGIREYSSENCATIAFIKCMRAANVSIDGLSEYIKLYQEGLETIQDRKAILVRERNHLKERMQAMEAALEKLNSKIALYDNGGMGCVPCKKK
ncbi:MAG: MerR family transcriptional regulator [Megasphaera sp.]|jgi:DNA-binding transcriptional MerR regulator|nr:MerR family transcriptional regulator [Megasphaera sp.]MCH4187648.1 MerR family transcriptional regulator [Megasphaera sp.]MCH4217156.1 MerR family transcriptional regulator [Megasphaera sp.]